jgi:methionyl-tRNA formyltransferase
MIVDVLRDRPVAATPQPAQGVTYAAKVAKAEKRLDWSQDAVHLERQVRAFEPDAWCRLPDGRVLKVLRTAALAQNGKAQVPGTLLDDALLVACGSGALRLLEVKKEGARAMPAPDFLRGQRLPGGARLS